MTPERIAKIRRIADDARGDPATRAVAARILARCESPARSAPTASTRTYVERRCPGLVPSEEYAAYRYKDLNGWKKTTNGNFTHAILRNGILWRVILFKHKRSESEWGWMKTDLMTDRTEFSNERFGSVIEAHRASWKNLSENV